MPRWFLALGLFVTAGVVATYAFLLPAGQAELSSKSLADDPRVQAISNKHLFMTAKELEISVMKRMRENQLHAPYIGQKIVDLTYQGQKGVDHSPDRNEETAYRDLHRYDTELNYSNPQNVVQGQLKDKQMSAEYVAAYQREYARQFVENARRAGYEVRLSADLVVQSVRKINSSPQ